MKKLFVAALLAVSGAVFAQTETAPYKPGVTEEGAVYFLPKTSLRITLLVEKTTYKPGMFAKYAERYLRLMDVEQKETVKHKVINIGMKSYGEADKSKAYTVKFNAKTSATNVVLAEDGTLLAINTDPYKIQPTTEFVAAQKPAKTDPRKYMKEEILAAQSLEKMAELTASDIYEIRESKNLLTRGQADFMPKDGAQLQIMLNDLNAQDKALTQLFTGTIEKDTTEHVIELTPDKNYGKQILFRLSQKLGFVDKDDLSGTPYYLSIEDLKSLPEYTPVPDNKKKGDVTYGIFVNVPGRIQTTIFKGNQMMGRFDLSAAQFGFTEFLSGDLFNKRYTTKLVLSPYTGAILKLEAEMPK